MINPSVSFFTPIASDTYLFAEIVDSYFWFGGKVAEVIDPEMIEEGSIAAKNGHSDTTLLATVFKISTMILSFGILPLMALILKVIIRCNYQFHYVAEQAPHLDRDLRPGAVVPGFSETEMDRAITLSLLANSAGPALPNDNVSVFAKNNIIESLRIKRLYPAQTNAQLLHDLPEMLDVFDRAAESVDQAVRGGNRIEIEKAIALHDWAKLWMKALDQIPSNEIAVHYSNLRESSREVINIAEGIELNTVEPERFLSHLETFAARPVRLGMLKGQFLVKQIQSLQAIEVNRAKSAARAAQDAEHEQANRLEQLQMGEAPAV